MKFYREIAGHRVYLKRRRYSNATFTWAYLKIGSAFMPLPGDPWPCVIPKLEELTREILLWSGTPTSA